MDDRVGPVVHPRRVRTVLDYQKVRLRGSRMGGDLEEHLPVGGEPCVPVLARRCGDLGPRHRVRRLVDEGGCAADVADRGEVRDRSVEGKRGKPSGRAVSPDRAERSPQPVTSRDRAIAQIPDVVEVSPEPRRHSQGHVGGLHPLDGTVLSVVQNELHKASGGRDVWLAPDGGGYRHASRPYRQPLRGRIQLGVSWTGTSFALLRW